MHLVVIDFTKEMSHILGAYGNKVCCTVVVEPLCPWRFADGVCVGHFFVSWVLSHADTARCVPTGWVVLSVGTRRAVSAVDGSIVFTVSVSIY